jgi:PAS domain S-box-containing protein
MARLIKRTARALLAVAIILAAAAGCDKNSVPAESRDAASPFASFRDVPGVTAEEIAALERWMTKTYDFKAKLMEARLPWLAGAAAMTFIALALLALLFHRRRNLRERQEADARTQFMLEYTPLVVMLWDKDLKIIDCNQEAVRIFGLSSKKEYMERFFEFAPEYQPNGMATREVLLKAQALIFHETEFARMEWTHNHAVTGEAIPFDITLVRIKYKDEYVAMSYALDLRERNATLAKMREADERAQILFDTAPLASFMFDNDENLLDCNQETVNLFGLPDKEFYLRNFRELSPEYQPSGALSAEAAIRNNRLALEQGYHRFEWMHQKLGGEPLPTEMTLVRVRHKDEYMIAAYVRDLTEQKAAERLTKSVQEKTATLTAIFDSTPDMMFCKDVNLYFTECNKALENYFNVRKADVIGKSLVDGLNIPPEVAAQLFAADKRVIAERRATTSEELVKSFDGRMVHFEITRAPLMREGEIIGIVGLARDLTQRQEMAQMAKQQAAAEAANRAKSSFLAAMSHEMRTPMNTILGVTEIQLQNESLAAATKSALQRIYSSGYLLLAIINNLLDLSKIEAGKLELANERYETASLINDTVNLSAARLGSKPIEFKLHVDQGLPFALLGDELCLKQILNNLLSNAFKYTNQGVVELSFRAETALEEGGDAPFVTLTIIVRDTGQGMTPEQLRDLFDSYSRFNQKANRFVEGTGLGMNIVRHLVNKMGGDIAVDSEPGRGTEVTVRLRQGYAGSETLGRELAANLMSFRLAGTAKSKHVQITRERMPYGHVLVVDDMETNLYVARGFLLPYGLAIDTALSGPEAIAKIEGGHVYDIIFMDHMMPEMDGLEAVRAIRGRGYARPIVALTANAVAGQAENFLANGFDGFISKPIDIREMNAVLNKFVRDRQPPEVLAAVRAAYGEAAPGPGPPPVDREMRKVFIHDAEKASAILAAYEARGSYESDDLRMFTIQVHALKSALASVGEADLSDLAGELEQAGRNGDTAAVSGKTPAFLRELSAVMDKLRLPEAGEDGAGDVSDADKAHWRKMLSAVREACAEFDTNAARDALAELGQKSWPGAYAKLLDTIAEHLLQSDFDEAAAACEAGLAG